MTHDDPFTLDGRPDGEPRDVRLGDAHPLPLTFCPKCARAVWPIGRGQCPGCGRVLDRNFAARRHPANERRIDQLKAAFIAEFRPPTFSLELLCGQLASATEQLEHTRPSGIEWTRLTSVAQSLRADLRAAAPSSRPTRVFDVLPELADRAEQLARVARQFAADDAARRAARGTPPPTPEAPEREQPEPESHTPGEAAQRRGMWPDGLTTPRPGGEVSGTSTPPLMCSKQECY